MSTIADFNYGRQAVYGTFVLGGWLDIGWVIASLSYGLAGLWQATTVASTHSLTAAAPADHNTPRRLTTWLSYLPASGAFAAFLMLEYYDLQGVHLGLWVTGTVGLLIGLLLIRQTVTMHENRKLYLQVHQQTIMLQAEIEERKRVEDQLAYDTVHDPLTELPNRVTFLDRLRNALALTKEQQTYHFAVLFLDIDHFKVVNDSLGHLMGDQLLLKFAQRLRQLVRPGDMVARLSGDEFVILLENIQDLQESITITTRESTTALSSRSTCKGP